MKPQQHVDLFKSWVFLHKANKAVGKVSFQDEFMSLLETQWQKSIDDAVEAGVVEFNGFINSRSKAETIASSVASGVRKKLVGWSKPIEKSMRSLIQSEYDLQAFNFLKEFPDVSKASIGKGAKFKINFSQADEKAMEMIFRFSSISAGSLFPNDVADKVYETVLEQTSKGLHITGTGLNIAGAPKSAAEKIRFEIMGAVGSENLDKLIPTRFKTNTEEYFNILADHSSVLSTNTGRLISMNEGGVEYYEVVAVLDSRTSEICRQMNGRKIAVSSGMKMLDKMLTLNGPGALKEEFPWENKQLAPDTLENNNRLAESGYGFPPYHGRCRSYVVPVF